MKLFRRKEEEEEEEGEEEKESSKKKKRPRKKRKTPPKPWGKRERIALAIILVATMVISAILSIRARSWKVPGLPRLKIPKIVIPFLGREEIVIEGDKGKNSEIEKITDRFKNETNGLSGVYALYVVRIGSGVDYGVEKESIFQAASLMKLPVMAGMYLWKESGKLNLDEVYILKDEDKVGGSGNLYWEDEGFALTYRRLVELMGKYSDNTAFNITVKILGKDKIQKMIDNMGMVNTSFGKNETTPRDIGLFFEKLWEGEILEEENRDELLSFLTDTIYEDHLVAGVPAEIRVAHKYGRDVNVVNDAGIVFSRNPYIVVLMSQGIMMDEADKAFPEISQFIYSAENVLD